MLLNDGSRREFGALLIATGAEPIQLPIPGAETTEVRYLRTFADSRAERFYRGRGWVEEARWPWVDGRVFLQLVRE